MRIDVIGFDADDTLWHNEPLYTLTEEKFITLLSAHHTRADIEARLYATEIRNLEHFGYGIKGFTLSMIETAIELTGGDILGREIQQIIDYAREMLRAPVNLLDHAAEAVQALAASHTLILITKGDLFDQESKVARSGLANYFAHVEVVSEKDKPTYEAVLRKRGIDPATFLMVGNSLRSDILPIVALGGRAVHIPYLTTWTHETLGEPLDAARYHALAHIGLLPALIQQLST
jgi:putative hydrolase of the HAD superfamily